MRSEALSRKTNLPLYKTLILPVLIYGTESRRVSVLDAVALGLIERKFIRKIFGLIRVGDEIKAIKNQELRWK